MQPTGWPVSFPAMSWSLPRTEQGGLSQNYGVEGKVPTGEGGGWQKHRPGSRGAAGGVDERCGADAELAEAESMVDPAGAELSAAGCPLRWTQWRHGRSWVFISPTT
jgi:hypothetical protein